MYLGSKFIKEHILISWIPSHRWLLDTENTDGDQENNVLDLMECMSHYSFLRAIKHGIRIAKRKKWGIRNV